MSPREALDAGMQRRRRIEADLRDFIRESLLDADQPDGIDPLAADAVDSLGLEQLVAHVESGYGVTIANEEMVRQNFSSVAALAALVDSKLEEA